MESMAKLIEKYQELAEKDISPEQGKHFSEYLRTVEELGTKIRKMLSEDRKKKIICVRMINLLVEGALFKK